MNRTFDPFKSWLSDTDLREVFWGSTLAMIVKVLAAGTAFLMNLVVARILGADEAGLFFLGMTLVTLLAALSRIGLDNTVVRYISAEASHNNWAAVKGVYRKAVLWASIMSLIGLSLLLLFSERLNRYVFKLPGFDQVLWILAFSLPLVVLYTLHAQALQGLRKIAKAMLVLNVTGSLAMLIFVWLLPMNSAHETAWMYIAACFLAVLLGRGWWKSAVAQSNEEAIFDSRRLLASCLPLWAVMLFGQMVQWSSQILLGVWGTTIDVALFASAQRTAMLASFVLVAVNSIAAPKFAAMYHHGDMVGLRRTALVSVRLMLLAAVPALLLMLIFPEWLMGLFGLEFRAAAGALMILAVGQFINIATGSVGFLLSMTGHERKLRLNAFIGATVGVGLGIFLIPLYGIIGAAIATASAVGCQNLLGVYQVKNLLGFNTLAVWEAI